MCGLESSSLAVAVAAETTVFVDSAGILGRFPGDR
jgi:hypothetical protein